MESFGWWGWSLLVPAALAGGWLGTLGMLAYTRRAGIVDRPSDRRLHTEPTPRGGGVAVAAVFVVFGAVLAVGLAPDGGALPALLATAALVAVSGWLEDSRGLSVGLRLGIQVTAALGILVAVGIPESIDAFGVDLATGAVGWPLALLWLVWLPNLYNFMDGADGIAATQAAIAGAIFGLWFAWVQAPAMAVLCWCLAAASLGFLYWNRAPARIFMGDAGSLFLGFAFGGIAWIGVTVYAIPWSAFVLGLGLFIGDATWTLLARMAKGEAWWRPHRSHFYQRALAAGWSHRRLFWAIVGLGALFAGLGTLDGMRIGPRWLWPVVGLVTLLGSATSIRRRETGAAGTSRPIPIAHDRAPRLRSATSDTPDASRASPARAPIRGVEVRSQEDPAESAAVADGGVLLDYERLLHQAEKRHEEYVHADPYPHIVLDDFLPKRSLERVLETFPSADPEDSEVRWRRLDADTRDGRPVMRGKLDFFTGGRGLTNEYFVHPVIRQLFWELNSSTFVRVLERLTGIQHLIPDPHMQGGGIHHIHRGGMLEVHTDFNRHPDFDLDRRLNVLLYLNEDWKEEYGGHIELWSRDMKRCVRRVLPVANRVLVFSTLRDSYHGHPHPLSCPEGRTRQSVAMYYYTHGRPEEEGREAHETIWRDTPDESEA